MSGHDGAVSTSWSTPDPRRTAALPPAFAATPQVLPAPAAPAVGQDARAGVLAAAITLLAGAPVGLLWAALAPRVDIVIQGTDVNLAVPGSSAFIAGDGYFLGAVLLAGVISGLAAEWLGRRHGPGVVLGLALGGLAAAYVAMVVGQTVGVEQVQQAVDSGQQGALTLNLRLRAREALVGWPVGALIGYVSASLTRGR